MRTIVIAILGLSLAACAEQQAAAPTPPTAMVADADMSCTAIIKEQDANTRALRVVNDEYLDQTKFTRAKYLLGARENAPSLTARNDVLAKLHAKRGC